MFSVVYWIVLAMQFINKNISKFMTVCCFSCEFAIFRFKFTTCDYSVYKKACQQYEYHTGILQTEMIHDVLAREQLWASLFQRRFIVHNFALSCYCCFVTKLGDLIFVILSLHTGNYYLERFLSKLPAR